MNVPAICVGNVIASAAIPATGLLLGPVHAWVLLLTLLALCCGVLWVLTRPVSTEEATVRRPHAEWRPTGAAAHR